MAKNPRLSVLCVFRNQREEIEPALTALFELESLSPEIIIIDDASNDGSREIVHSLLDHYQHDHAYYFEHERPLGRGNSLNEGLQHVTAKYLWAPDRLDSIDEETLNTSLERLDENEAACLLQQPEALPVEVAGWISFLDARPLPHDSIYLWNLNELPGRELFFNPYLIKYHGTELALRTLGGSDMLLQAPFFGIEEPEDPIKPDHNVISEFVYSLLRRPGLDPQQKEFLMSLLNPSVTEPIKADQGASSDELMEQALTYYRAGNISAALELADAVNEDNKNYREAIKLKIEVLEKLRRYVEAAELKHLLKSREAAETEPRQPKAEIPADEPGTEATQTEESAEPAEEIAEKKPPSEEPEPVAPASPEDLKSSIIIPTTADCKPLLERCLVSIGEHCDPATTEVIVIDNASFDDTYDYLSQLQRDQFFGCKVITNSENAGFARSVNQGLEAAEGTYACILHNDVILHDNALGKLERLMDDNPDFAIIGPKADHALNPDQRIERQVGTHAELLEAEYVDSFCMMLRTQTGLRMDEDYGLAFFEDLDLCFQAKSKGLRVGMAPQIQLEHLYGITTANLGLDLEGRQYWNNVERFNQKWNLANPLPEGIAEADPVRQLLVLDEILNPVHPEPHLVEYFHELMSDEVKTQLLKNDHDRDTLLALVHLLMVMDQRDILRQLEDRLDRLELPVALIRQLVSYYFEKNIYSRCKHYLEQVREDQKSPHLKLLELQLAVSEKEMNQAVELLKELMRELPFHPLLFRLAGDIHSFEGNREEAASFYGLAAQIDPFNYKETA